MSHDSAATISVVIALLCATVIYGFRHHSGKLWYECVILLFTLSASVAIIQFVESQEVTTAVKPQA